MSISLDDGNRWNNDTCVRMTVRNVQVFTDRPADL